MIHDISAAFVFTLINYVDIKRSYEIFIFATMLSLYSKCYAFFAKTSGKDKSFV